MAFLKFGGVDIPSPTGFQVERVPISSGERRSASGRAVIDFVGIKRRIEIEYHLMPEEAMENVLGSVVESGFFEVTYPEPGDGERTIQAYMVDFSAGLMQIVDGKRSWRDVRMTLMEA